MKIASLCLIVLTASMIVFVSMSPAQTKAYTNTTEPLVSHIDTTVRPGDDFFLYANGRWFKEHPIPPSEQSNGLWQLIQDTINAQVRTICESSATLRNPEKGSAKQKIGDFFFTGMDSVSLNRDGLRPLKDQFDRIDAIRDAGAI